jgi:inorganic triphosphatase YgiF
MEIESKFAVPDEATWLRLQSIEQVADYTLSVGKMKQVHDTFMDTPTRDILRSGHVCRKREVDGQIVMTLKSKQQVVGTVHRREELEVTLPHAMPIGQWPPSEIRDRLLSLIGDVPLTPLFDQSQQRFVRWAKQGDRVVAEMSVDKVELAINDRTQSYFEVEFELKDAGTEDDLANIDACLIAEWGLTPEPRSKFARARDFAGV